jgi:hypothetical protein
VFKSSERPAQRTRFAIEQSDSSSDDSGASDDDGGLRRAAAAKASAGGPALALGNPFSRMGQSRFKQGADSRAREMPAKQAMLQREEAFNKQVAYPVFGGLAQVKTRAPGKSSFGSWAARYVAAGHGALTLLKSKSDPKPVQSLPLPGIIDAEVAGLAEAGKPHALSVTDHRGGMLIMSFDGDGARDELLGLLLGVAQINRDMLK